jgi:hypothetical protein
MKGKINEFPTQITSKNITQLYTGINGFKRGYQPRYNLVKNGIGDLLEDSNKILIRWMNYSQSY